MKIAPIRNTLIASSVLAGGVLMSCNRQETKPLEQKFEYPTTEFYDSLSANLGKQDIISYYDGRIIGEKFKLNDTVDVERMYSNTTGEIECEIFRNKNHPELPYSKRIDYSGEYKFIENNFAESTVKNLLVEELEEDLNSKFLLFKNIDDRLKHNILNRINTSNVFKVLDDYETQTGRNLLDDLHKIKNPFSIKERNLLIRHINKSIKNYDNKNLKNVGIYVSNKLYKEYLNKNKNGILENIDLLNSKTITFFFEENNNKYKIYDGFLENLEKKFGKDYALEIAHKLSKIALKSGFDKDGLFLYTDDIKKDILSHPDDLRKLDVDFMRLGNRKIIDSTESRFNSYKFAYYLPNGKIDKPFSQGHIGECSIISEISALIEKTKGKKYLESLLSYNKKTGDITVNLAGVNKKYTFSPNYLKKLKSFTNGDGDIRAIEAAVDKYLKENAYENRDTKAYDITIGNDGNTLFELLIGNSTYYWYPSLDDLSIDFNNPNKAFTIAINSNPYDYTGGTKVFSDKKEYTKLFETHAYAVAMSDKDAIYFIDPNDKNNTGTKEEYIKVLKKDLYRINCSISTVKIPD